MPRSTTPEQLSAAVDGMLARMGLAKCALTTLGRGAGEGARLK